jgi:CspA family cold shock protein
MDGSVKWFNVRKGYGFIQGADGSDYFVHHSQVDGNTTLKEGEKVTFEAADDPRGKKASNVKVSA